MTEANRRISLRANGDGTVDAVNAADARVTIDPEGRRGLTPLELFLAALGSCGAVDVAELMRKQRAPILPFSIEVEGEKEDVRMRWLRVRYVLGSPVDGTKLDRAVRKSGQDLCTISRTLEHGCHVEHVAENPSGLGPEHGAGRDARAHREGPI
jgi:uncharacterized OsmC-like protein